MKKVIFVCLLSLSMCFSEPLEAASQTPAVEAKSNAATTDVKATEAKPEHPQTAAAETLKPSVVIPGHPNATAANGTQDVTVSNKTSITTNETKPAEKDNSTEIKPSDPVKPVDPAKEKNEAKPAGNVPANNGTANNGTNAESKDSKKNETTTPKGENVKPTVAPVEAKSRAFDGPSFIGGIILTLGLLAIGFMGFKYYKNQTERNYHTL